MITPRNIVNPTAPRKKARPGTPTEQNDAFSLIEYADLRPWGRLLAHVMNEQLSGKKSHGSFKKAEGVRPGYPDYLLDLARGGWFGFRLELKRPDGWEMSDKQYAWQARLLEEGYLSVIAPGWCIAVAWIEWYYSQQPTSKTVFRQQDNGVGIVHALPDRLFIDPSNPLGKGVGGDGRNRNVVYPLKDDSVIDLNPDLF